MRKLASIGAVLAVLLLPARSAPAIAVMPPEIVGPQGVLLGTCPLKVTMPGGTAAGPEIPYPALRLGGMVARNANSFPTGGSGTAAAFERARRMRAGLQYDPETFDPATPGRLSVFATEPTQVPVLRVYQRLPLKVTGKTVGPYGMIFAQTASPRAGRIVSLALTLSTPPSAKPGLTITGGRPGPGKCEPDAPIQVYAPSMTAPQLRRLFSASGCNWYQLGRCARAERPRGRVLFVQKRARGFVEYRWVDYDLLAGTR